MTRLNEISRSSKSVKIRHTQREDETLNFEKNQTLIQKQRTESIIGQN